jgi:hypothetical protein
VPTGIWAFTDALGTIAVPGRQDSSRRTRAGGLTSGRCSSEGHGSTKRGGSFQIPRRTSTPTSGSVPCTRRQKPWDWTSRSILCSAAPPRHSNPGMSSRSSKETSLSGS